MERQAISPSAKPSPVPISPAVRVGDLVFCSGQIGTDPETGQLAGAGVREQTEQVLENMKAILQHAGSSMEKVDKCTVFITDRNDYNSMNEIYRKYFPKDPPARSCVVVAALARPELVVEIECIAHR
jgi:2-iminobutanoate/2-iminopropanoate deaminase